MTSDIEWGRLFGRLPAARPATAAPPAPTAVDPSAELDRLRKLSAPAMQQHLRQLLDALRVRSAASDPLELHEDGSPKVPSMIAVGLLSEVASSIGRPRLTVLAREPRSDLLSLKGLTRLVIRCISPAATVTP
jgi:hypothetical protein